LKKKLAMVILVVLALATFNVLMLPNGKAQTISAQVLSYSWYVAPSTTTSAVYINDLIVVGEVQNTGSTVAGRVWVTGQAYLSNGTVVAYSEAPAIGVNLEPNQKAPFYLDFIPENSLTQDQSWVSNISSVTVSVNNIINITSTLYGGVTTSNVNGGNVGGTYTVAGTTINTGSQYAGDVAVVATFYNASAAVVGIALTDLGPLSPGQSAPFTITPWDNTAALTNAITNYSILIEATPAAAPQSTTTPTALPTSTSSSSKPTQAPGTPTSALTYLVVIVVVAVVAIIVVGLILLRRPSHQTEALSTTAPPTQP
jgi:hypothetical protein